MADAAQTDVTASKYAETDARQFDDVLQEGESFEESDFCSSDEDIIHDLPETDLDRMLLEKGGDSSSFTGRQARVMS